jgi:ADP-ribose pyrophosphatase
LNKTEPGQVSSRRVYSGRVIDLNIDQVRFPDGSVGELEIIRHSGASAVVPFVSEPTGDDPQIILIHQYRYAANGYVYEVPAGRLEPGEAPEVCAHRELEEETGCRAERVERLTTIYTTPGFTDERIHLFAAYGLTAGKVQRDADEFIQVKTMPLSEALAMISRGEIVDGKTISALLFVAGFRLGT